MVTLTLDSPVAPSSNLREERRRKPRIGVPFPATVRGVDASGQRFRCEATLANLSAGGLYLTMEPRLAVGAPFRAWLWLSPAHDAEPLGLDAVALRVEPLPGLEGCYGVAAAISVVEPDEGPSR